MGRSVGFRCWTKMLKIAVANQKGGVAKTTTAITLGHAMSEMGKRVLLVDMDPQGHLAEGFGMPSEDIDLEMSAVLNGDAQITDIIHNIRPNLDLAPSNIRLSAVEAKLFLKHRREDKLKNALRAVEDRYQVILIDCPPSLGLLTVNALSAVDKVLIPMACEFFSMLGVSLLLQTIEDMRAELNPGLTVLGILPTRATRTIHSREVIQRTQAELDGHVHVFGTVIGESVRFREATALGQTILEYAPDIAGARAYRQLAQELCHG